MQSDTFLNDTDSDDEAYSSDSSDSQSDGRQPKNNNIGLLYEFPKEAVVNERFMDQSSQEKYLGIRNELFTRGIETSRICFYTNWDDSYKDELDLVDQFKLGGVTNIIGFELISADIMNHTDNLPFVDLVIPEIPHKACKLNERGIPIISRLKTYTNADSTNHYGNEPQRSYSNYFTPIKLSKLTLDLYKPNGTKVLVGDGYKIFYEFEASILKRSLSEK